MNLFKPEQPVSFVLPTSAGAPRLTFAAIAAPDLGSRLPKDDPAAPSGTKGQPDLPVSPGQAADAVRPLKRISARNGGAARMETYSGQSEARLPMHISFLFV